MSCGPSLYPGILPADESDRQPIPTTQRCSSASRVLAEPLWRALWNTWNACYLSQGRPIAGASLCEPGSGNQGGRGLKCCHAPFLLIPFPFWSKSAFLLTPSHCPFATSQKSSAPTCLCQRCPGPLALGPDYSTYHLWYWSGHTE